MNKEEVISEEAAGWFSRIREGELSSSERKQFAQWTAESPVHVREYLAVSETWGALQAGQCWPEESSDSLLKSLSAMRPALSPSVSSSRSTDSQRAGARRAAFRLALAAGAALIALSAVWLWRDMARSQYTTARGEQRSVVLPDGSVVQLNTLSKLAVNFDKAARRVELSSGEAYFRVAQDSGRSFTVETPHAVVHALGTEFDVYNRAGGTRVAVIEGKVRVISHAAQPPVDLAPEQSAEVSAKGKIALVKRSRTVPETRVATAWMQRRIVLDGDRVDGAVAEFNRYNKGQMRVADPELAALKISGVFSADDPKALVKYLERVQGVEAQEVGGEVVLKKMVSR